MAESASRCAFSCLGGYIARVVGWLVPPLLIATVILSWLLWRARKRQAELREVAVVNEQLILSRERDRFAQDLHDILGHSLTVLAVKSELASRLLDIDLDRARAEVLDLERLSREALSDVRRAVHGYKDLSLSGELLRARQALETAGIDAEIPKTDEHVEGEFRELFAWTIREGITNVIRHSAAQHCRVELYPDRVVVVDDGRGPIENGYVPGQGYGLSGLEDRAAAAGAVVRTRKIDPNGFALEVIGGSR